MTQMKKRNLGILVAVMATVMISAVSVGSSYAIDPDFASTSPKIIPEEATQIAVNHLKTDISNLVEIDIDREDGVFLYSIDFIIDKNDVSVEIDPQTGEILLVESEPRGNVFCSKKIKIVYLVFILTIIVIVFIWCSCRAQ